MQHIDWSNPVSTIYDDIVNNVVNVTLRRQLLMVSLTIVATMRVVAGWW
jgi:hypothetical protein